MSAIKFIYRLIVEASYEWSHDRAARLGAALAYYALFSFAPLLVIMITIAGSFYGEAAAKGQIVQAISGEIGPQAAVAVEQMLAGIHESGSNLLTTILSSVILVFAATNLFSQLRDALNTMWHVRLKRPEHFWGGLLNFAWDRFLSMAMVICLSVFLLAALALSASLTVLNGWLKTIVSTNASSILEGGNLVTGFLVTFLLFAIMFKLLPDVQISWRVVGAGALITSILFNAGAFLIGLYFGFGGARSILGAAGSLVIIMIWISYSAQIVFFGAKFALVYASAAGTPILPASNAIRMKFTQTEPEIQNE